jgi:hypothetical protein
MKHARTFELVAFALAFALTFAASAQQYGPTIKVEVKSAFVWGEDATTGAVSSTIQDPLTGNAIHKLSYSGVEVSSRMGFEGVGADETGTFLNYTTTVVNGTDSTLSMQYGGVSVDGHVASPLWVVPPGKKLNKSDRKRNQDVAELGKMHCFTSGFLAGDNFVSANTSAQVLVVAPRSALTVSGVIRDPRGYHSIVCSVAGCYPIGTIRYYVRVGGQDYVFVWPGRSAIYCGK